MPAKGKKLPNGKIMYKGKEMTVSAYKNELRRDRGAGPKVKKITSSPDEARSKQAKKDAKRSAKALKATKPLSPTQASKPSVQAARGIAAERAKSAKIKADVGGKPLTEAQKLALKRYPKTEKQTPRGGGLRAGGRLGGGGAMNWYTK